MDVQSARTEHAASFLAPGLCRLISALSPDAKARAQEIRLRVDNPLGLHTGLEHLFVLEDGGVCRMAGQGCHRVTPEEMRESFRRLCGYSVHSHQNEIAAGYLSVEGGHRAGICGTAVNGEGGMSGLREITSINLRIARQITGAADELLKRIFNGSPHGLLLAGPPSSGKTTLLRDLARQLSAGRLGCPLKVAVIDERGELSAVHNGRVQNDLGPCTDVLCGVRKCDGILMAVRSLSPQVIICDEIGGMEEIQAISAGLNCGAVVITTIHAGSKRELLARPQLRPLLETGAFETIVLLRGAESPSQIQWIEKAGELYAQACGSGIADSLRLGGRNELFPPAGLPGEGP